MVSVLVLALGEQGEVVEGPQVKFPAGLSLIDPFSIITIRIRAALPVAGENDVFAVGVEWDELLNRSNYGDEL